MNKDLIKKNIEHYKKYIVEDNRFGSGMISKIILDTYRYTSNCIAIRQCKRQGFKPDNSRYWGYKCYYLDESKGAVKLYKYAVNWSENRPKPSYYDGYEPQIVATGINAKNIYEKLDGYQEKTFCNINVAIYIDAFGANKLAKSMLSFSANKTFNLLQGNDNSGLNYGNFTLQRISYPDSMKYTELGLFVFAIRKDRIGHLSPIISSDVWVNKNDLVRTTINDKCAWCLNIGRKDLDGYNSIFRSFYVNNLKDIEYYVLLKTDL